MSDPAAPPRRLGRPPAIDSAETRQRILDVARRHFARQGYDATTNKDIADEVGITTGAIYHYFESKADLYLAVYTEVQALVYGEFEKAVAEPQRFNERLDAVLDAATAVNRRDPSVAGFVVGVSAEAERHPELVESLRPLMAAGTNFFRSLVDDAIARGELADGLDAQAVTDMITAVTGGLARFSTAIDDAARHRRATVALQRLIDGTLMRGGPWVPPG